MAATLYAVSLRRMGDLLAAAEFKVDFSPFLNRNTFNAAVTGILSTWPLWVFLACIGILVLVSRKVFKK